MTGSEANTISSVRPSLGRMSARHFLVEVKGPSLRLRLRPVEPPYALATIVATQEREQKDDEPR